MQPEFVEYPRDEFSAQYRLKNERGGFAGNTPRPFAQIKYVLPAIQEGQAIQYDIHSAIVLQSANIRNDLSALVHQVTIKGIGASEANQRARGSNETLKQSADVVFDQIGLGSANGLVSALVNGYFYGVENSTKHQIDMQKEGALYGKVDAGIFVLSDPKYLRNNGFPADKFDLPNKASCVIYSRIKAHMSSNQITAVLKDTAKRFYRYDRSTRIILRENHPFSLYDNWGRNPTMNIFTAFSSSSQPTPSLRTINIPLEPVTEALGTSDTPQKS